MTMPARTDTPWFSYEAEVSPVPAGPTACRGCGAELEPLRRTAGLCKQCVAQRPPAQPPAAQVMVLVRWFYRNRGARKERFVEVRCACGRKRTMQWSAWQHHRPQSCHRCRLRGVERRGFEAEYAR